jgi:hypothetical protein
LKLRFVHPDTMGTGNGNGFIVRKLES